MKGGGQNKKNFNRNRSFGDGGGPSNSGGGWSSPQSPKKRGSRPAKRSYSHDNSKPFNAVPPISSKNNDDDDGFTAVGGGGSKKKLGGRFANENNRNNNNSNNNWNNSNNNNPRGRMNPTSSFNRPRSTQSFNKPRPTGSFNNKNRGGRGGENNNNRNNNNNQSFNQSGGGGGGFDDNRRTRSFNRPRPTGSFHNNNTTNTDQGGGGGGGGDNNSTSYATNAQAKRELYRRSTSRLSSYDVELYTQGDGKSQQQRNVVRLNVDVLMRQRLSNLDKPTSFDEPPKSNDNLTTPAFARDGPDTFGPHHKCLWDDPTRKEQIEQIMQQYPNAIPLHMKKRTRIVSSKLGDATTISGVTQNPSMASSVQSSAADDDNNNFENLNDDSSIGGDARSIMSGGAETIGTNVTADSNFFYGGAAGQEDMNPLRKTLMLLNKLSWTTINKLTPKLFDILEQDVPNLITPMMKLPPSLGGGGGGVPTSIKTGPQQQQQQQDNSESSEQGGGGGGGNDNKAAAPPPTTTTTELLPMVVTILTLIVEKAQTEPHFSAMYAQLCKNLAERNMAWRKKILAHCQLEFEHDIAFHTMKLDERLEQRAKAAAAAANTNTQAAAMAEDNKSISSTNTEDMDRDYQLLQLRKKYLGHCQFIGELFKLKLIKLDIMIWCLSRLLFHKEQVDEDDLECFAKLMTVVGEQAETLVKKGKCHAVAEEKWYQCWDRIYWLTGRTKKATTTTKKSKQRQQQQQQQQQQEAKSADPPPKISSRIRFMLVDLLELEENDWVLRRQEEKAKTIAEIHEEVREEEEESRRRGYSDDWSGSFGGSRRRRTYSDDGSGFSGGRRRVNSDDYTQSPTSRKPRKFVDADGFTEIPKKTGMVRRAVSDTPANNNNPGWKQPNPPGSPKSRSRNQASGGSGGKAKPKIVEFPDPQECKDKTKTILKEYFVGGDTQDAILSIDELVGAGRDNEGHGSVERGAAVVESGVLLVMEMKQQEVQKFLAVMKRCLQQNKIEKESLPLGLKDPMEFLSDIEIDAPMARSLLTSIVSYWVREDFLPFNFLLGAPDYFKTDGNAAEFATGVLKLMGDDPSEDDLGVIEQLMTEDDKKKFSTPKEMLAPQT